LKPVIREYVQFVLNEKYAEDEWKLRRWFNKLEPASSIPGTYEQFEQTLFDHGMTPIRVPKGTEDSSLLGLGEYSVAFEVLYNGKHAVAKITKSRKDVSIPLALDQLRKSLPAPIARHFLEVYDVFFTQGMYVIVVEFLQPMPANVKAEEWGSRNDYADPATKKSRDEMRSKAFSENPEKIGEIFDDVLADNWISTLMPQKTMNAVRARFLSGKGFNKVIAGLSNPKAVIDDKHMKSYMRTVFKSVNKGGGMFKQLPAPDLIDAFSAELSKTLMVYAGGERPYAGSIGMRRFPTSHTDEFSMLAAKHSENKQVVSLARAMQYIKNHHGILHWDLHPGNVMQRPGTGELVVSDPGLFDLPGAMEPQQGSVFGEPPTPPESDKKGETASDFASTRVKS